MGILIISYCLQIAVIIIIIIIMIIILLLIIIFIGVLANNRNL
jgi:hypothetical protein